MNGRINPFRARAPYDWKMLLRFVQTEFAYMDARIDPPSSMHLLTPEKLQTLSETAEIWVIDSPPVACVFLSPRIDSLHIGKLAVARDHRGKGHARALIKLAAARANVLGLAALTLQARIELEDNHAVFRALGFIEAGRSSHPGYDRATSLDFRKAL